MVYLKYTRVTIVNHEGEARVVCIVTVECCISVVSHYYLCFMWLVSCSNCQPCSNYHVLTSNHVLAWSGLDKLQAVPLICMASMIQIYIYTYK